MDEFEDFDSVFYFKTDYAYDHKVIEVMLANRHTLENELFLDRLLRVIGVKQVSKLYPPRSNQDLRTLHQNIVSSTSPDHHKLSLIYYVLKDCIHFPDDAERFADKYYLPDKYRTYIEGLWHLDRLKYERALGYLTEPSLIPTFPAEILYVLCVHAATEDITLPLAYYHTVSPPLSSVKVLDAYFDILGRSSVTEAFYFSRSHPEDVHKHLLEHLMGFVHSGPSGESRSDKGLELINLPFNEEEEKWFEEYLLHGKGRTLHGAKDTVMMRRIASGKIKEAFYDSMGLSGRKTDGVNWDTLKDSIQRGAGPRIALLGLTNQ